MHIALSFCETNKRLTLLNLYKKLKVTGKSCYRLKAESVWLKKGVYCTLIIYTEGGLGKLYYLSLHIKVWIRLKVRNSSKEAFVIEVRSLHKLPKGIHVLLILGFMNLDQYLFGCGLIIHLYQQYISTNKFV